MLNIAFSSRRWLLIGALTFLMVSMLVAGLARPAHAATVCNNTDTITMGKFYIINNLWGASTGSGSQCLTSGTVSPSVITWSTTYNWTGQANSVKSYDAAILGWHWGFKLPNTGLPVQLSSGSNVVSNWLFDVTQNGAVSQNVAYDLWFHTNPNAGSVDPTDEVMIWLYKSGAIQPVGTRQMTVNMGGMNWELWRGTANTWNVFTYVSPINATSGPGGFNLSIFLNDLVSRGWLQSSKYLMGVEAGTEVFVGNGSLNVRYYSLDIQNFNNPTPFPTTRTNTPSAPTNTPTRTNPTATRTPTRAATTAPTRTATSGGGGSTCSPVNATITAPFTFDGAGNLCWRSNNLGSYINSWNLTKLTVNGVDWTNKHATISQLPPKASDGYWYISYSSSVAWGHFEAK